MLEAQSLQGLCVSPDHHRQRYGTLSTLCRSQALSWVMDGRITVRSGYGLPYYKSGDMLQRTLLLFVFSYSMGRAAENTTAFRFLIFNLYLSGHFMGLTLKVAHAKLPGLYGSNQTIPHTRYAFSKGGKIVPVHNTKGY